MAISFYERYSQLSEPDQERLYELIAKQSIGLTQAEQQDYSDLIQLAQLKRAKAKAEQ